MQKEGPWTQPGSHLGSKGWSVPTRGEQVDEREGVCVCVGGAWRLNEMSEEEGGKDLCVYVRFGGFTDKAENRCMCGRELGVGTRQKRRSSYFLG